MRARKGRLFVVAAVLLLGMPSPALAYLDPGAGSLLIQMVLGGIAMAAVMARVFWARLRGLFGRPPKPPGDKGLPPP
jgi:hypothetical protein